MYQWECNNSERPSTKPAVKNETGGNDLLSRLHSHLSLKVDVFAVQVEGFISKQFPLCGIKKVLSYLVCRFALSPFKDTTLRVLKVGFGNKSTAVQVKFSDCP